MKGLLLTHGAGSDAEHPTSLALERRVAPLPVRRMNFPYRLQGRRMPDRAPVLLQAIHDEAAAFAAELGCGPQEVVLGGRSMGGRMCSMAVADGLPAAGLVLLSYPLHPPGKPERLRVEHLPAITVPTLIVSGTRDPFGRPEELEQHLAAIPGPHEFAWVKGTGHEWKGRDDEVAEIVAGWLDRLDTGRHATT